MVLPSAKARTSIPLRRKTTITRWVSASKLAAKARDHNLLFPKSPDLSLERFRISSVWYGACADTAAGLKDFIYSVRCKGYTVTEGTVWEDICVTKCCFLLFKMIPTARVCALHCEEGGGGRSGSADDGAKKKLTSAYVLV